jgi:hypothetical protein
MMLGIDVTSKVVLRTVGCLCSFSLRGQAHKPRVVPDGY